MGAHDDFAGVGELQRVAHQIDEHLAQSPRVTSQPLRHRGVDQPDQEQPPAAGLLREQADHVVHDLAHRQVERVELEPAGLNLRDVQDIVDDPEQTLTGAPQRIGVLPLTRFEPGAQQELGHADHAVHGCAQLVAHHRDEGALHLLHRALLGDVAHGHNRQPLRPQPHVTDSQLHGEGGAVRSPAERLRTCAGDHVPSTGFFAGGV